MQHRGRFFVRQKITLMVNSYEIPTANGQRRLIRWARDYLDPEPPATRGTDRLSLPFAAPPE